jgi:hypothetical protein
MTEEQKEGWDFFDEELYKEYLRRKEDFIELQRKILYN